MAEMQRPDWNVARLHGVAARDGIVSQLHPTWVRLIRYCLELGNGEIEKLKIQDGLPMIAEVTTKKVKFSP